MKFKNKDGTVNSLPIVLIVSIVIIGVYTIIFGFDMKEEVGDVITEIEVTTTTTTETTTIQLCNDCSMRFKETAVDVSTNGEVDLNNLMVLDKIGIRNITFTSSDDNLLTINPYSNTFLARTGNQEGTVNIYASYGTINTEIKVNIIHPSKATIKFRYPYYFVSEKSSISPEIDTYPLGYNTSGMTFVSSDKKVFSASNNKNQISGKTVGEASYILSQGSISDMTTIYVVKNKINIKVQDGDSYKVQRDINVMGDQFDILVEYEDKEKQNFDNKNITITFNNVGLNAQAAYVTKGKEYNTLLYHIELSGTGRSTMRVELSDGSFTLFEIYKDR